MSDLPLRVMLVDDHQVVRDGIKLLLADTDDVVVCAEASTARDAVATAAQATSGVIVMDVRLSDGSGIEATRDIRAARPATQVLMLTSRGRRGPVRLDHGRRGRLCPQQIRGEELLRAIRAVGSGQSLGSGRHQERLGPPPREQAPAPGRNRPACRPRRASWPRSPRAAPTARSPPSWGWPRKTVEHVSSILAKLEVARRRSRRLPGPPTTMPGS